MLDKFKQMRELQNLQKELQKETAEAEKQGVRVVVNGRMEIVEINLNSELETQKQEQILVDVTNEAMKKVQKMAAQKMQGMGGGLGL